MAGHSKFSNIKHRKEAQDKKKSKVLSKLCNEITIAVQLGKSIDPNANYRLRSAMNTAKENNVPKEKINNAIKNATNKNHKLSHEITYEAYGPNKTAFIIETITDSKNRTSSEISNILKNNFGNLATPGSTTFMFHRLGMINYHIKKLTEDKILEIMSDFNIHDYTENDEEFTLYSDPADLHKLSDQLVSILGAPKQITLIWKPQEKLYINEIDTIKKVEQLLNALENQDDVQNISYNFQLDS